MSKPWQVHVFGIRHLSPAGAWHLRRFLDRIQPELVLVEGLADAGDLTRHWLRKDTRPPLAILAYTAELPVRTLVYPIARYSPEYQAVAWASEQGVPLEFIDLPSGIFLGLQDSAAERLSGSSGPALADPPDAAPEPAAEPARPGLYHQMATMCGEPDYETCWERHFEHNLNDDAYRLPALELGRALREFDQAPLEHRAENLVREAYMRRCIEQALDRGVAPDRIVVVAGAFHAPVLNGEHAPLSDQELDRLPRRDSRLTLMPYSWFRLSMQSGYGAGNAAPAYFDLMWDAINDGDLEGLPVRYLSLVARCVRDAGTFRSTAEVIEGARLARCLAALHNGSTPTLGDLHDAAVTLFGQGDRSSIAGALARIDVGTAIGELPDGVSRTSIQADFGRELARLKLEKYRSAVRQELQLDLRENRQVKGEAAAWLDLNRSTFLHRLRALGIPFAAFVPTHQHAATWAEHWVLQWSPESEVCLVESVLMGETVELAAAARLKSAIEQATTINAAAQLVHDACQCGLPDTMQHARQQLQTLATESSALDQIAEAAFELMQVVRFGDVRRFDTGPLLPLIDELFVQGCLALHAASSCNAAAAAVFVTALDRLNEVALAFHERVDEQLWQTRLQLLADADDRNPLLSGTACAILLERGWMENEQLAREVSRRLSPGISADLGAGWFEGLAGRNRYALIARQLLWEQLAAYVASLDEEQFRRSLVFLRRAFGPFGPAEKRGIAGNLAHIWGSDEDQTIEMTDGPLSRSEQEALDELNQFDFGDLS